MAIHVIIHSANRSESPVRFETYRSTASFGTIAHCPRRDEAPEMSSQHWRGALKSVLPPLLPAPVALLLSPRRYALPLRRCAWSSLVPQHPFVRGTYEKPLRPGCQTYGE